MSAGFYWKGCSQMVKATTIKTLRQALLFFLSRKIRSANLHGLYTIRWFRYLGSGRIEKFCPMPGKLTWNLTTCLHSGIETNVNDIIQMFKLNIFDVINEPVLEPCCQRLGIPLTGGCEFSKFNSIIYHRSLALSKSCQQPWSLFSKHRLIKNFDNFSFEEL